MNWVGGTWAVLGLSRCDVDDAVPVVVVVAAAAVAGDNFAVGMAGREAVDSRTQGLAAAGWRRNAVDRAIRGTGMEVSTGRRAWSDTTEEAQTAEGHSGPGECTVAAAEAAVADDHSRGERRLAGAGPVERGKRDCAVVASAGIRR